MRGGQVLIPAPDTQSAGERWGMRLQADKASSELSQACRSSEEAFLLLMKIYSHKNTKAPKELLVIRYRLLVGVVPNNK